MVRSASARGSQSRSPRELTDMTVSPLSSRLTKKQLDALLRALNEVDFIVHGRAVGARATRVQESKKVYKRNGKYVYGARGDV